VYIKPFVHVYLMCVICFLFVILVPFVCLLLIIVVDAVVLYFQTKPLEPLPLAMS
jgi:hypothetical protein